MQAKIKEKEKARELRYAGKSIKRIARLLNVAKSSVSIWCRDIQLTEEQKARFVKSYVARQKGALANKRKREKEIVTIKTLAKLEIDQLDPSDLKRLKDIGTVLYWAEGGKRTTNVDITNSDPEIIRVAMLWFRLVCRVPEDKFRVSIYYHYNQNEEKIKRYWSRISGVPLAQFNRSIFKREGTGHRRRILYRGTCKIRIADRNLFHRIMAWIEQLHLSKKFMGQ